MNNQKKFWSRREFVTHAGALGAVTLGTGASCATGPQRPTLSANSHGEPADHAPSGSTTANGSSAENESLPPTDSEPVTGGPQPDREPQAPLQVPRRPFGRSGVDVSVLALGGYFDAGQHPELLERALSLGIDYWEATLTYGGKGYGAFFANHPDTRKRVFVLGKSPSTEPDVLNESLTRILADLGSNYVDFFTVQGLQDPNLLDENLRRWVETAKSRGSIRYFGFSTHAMMPECLQAAARLDWIDGVMTAYNYRLMQDSRMEAAIASCAARGIAITAIKSQGLPTNPKATLGLESEAARVALSRFQDAGLSPFQAKLRAVWANPHIASICSMMLDDRTLTENSRAAQQPEGLSAAALHRLGAGARDSAPGYCTGCAHVCESRIDGDVPIAGIMRLLMYARSYGDRRRARAEFSALSARTRAALTHANYRLAEQQCPQGMAIGNLMAEAVRELGSEAG